MNLTINVSTHQLSAPSVKKSEFENHTRYSNADNQYRHRHRHGTLISDEDVDDDCDDDIVEEDGSSSMSSSPSIPDENINFDLVYALHTFTATVEGQASVVKGEALILMEDTNIYWWLVEVLKTREIGYIPAENIETPYERLARLNKHRNVELTSSLPVTTLTNSIYSTKKVTIADEDALTTINFYEVESEVEEDTDEDNGDYFDINSDDEACKTMEEDLSNTEHQLDSMNSPQSLVHFVEHDASTSSEEQHSLTIQQRQRKQRPRHYLTPSVLKRDSSSHSLSSEGSYKRHSLETHNLRVFAGNIDQGPLFHTFNIRSVATTEDLLKEVLKRFDIVDNLLDGKNTNEYYIAVQGADGDDYILGPQDKPVSIFKTLTASLTTPMPTVSQNICRKPQEDTTRRKRSSSFGDHGQTSYEEDSVIRFYIHRRPRRTQERHGLVYIKVSLYPDDYSSDQLSASYQQQQFVPASTLSTPSFFFKSKKTLSTDSIKTEIDRIDKVLPVSYDSLVGAVINTALEKLHIPDAEADGLPLKKRSSSLNSSTRKYSMFTRNEYGQEKLLGTTDTMATVLHDQQHQQVSDLLFIIRQSESPLQKSKQQLLSPLSLYHSKHNTPSNIGYNFGLISEGTETSGERQPSILSIVTNYSPEFTIGRQSSFKSNSTVQGSAKDDQRSNRILGQQQNQHKSLPSPAASNLGVQSPTTGLFRSRQISLPVSPASSGSSPLTSPASINKRHGCISKSGNTDSKKRKEKVSFKQQLKRLISWGSFNSLKQKNGRDLPVTPTSPDLSLAVTRKPQQHVPIVSSISSCKSVPGPTAQQPKVDIQSVAETIGHNESNSQCNISFSASITASSPLEIWHHVDPPIVDDNSHHENKGASSSRAFEPSGSSPAPKTNSDSHLSEVSTSTSILSSSHNSRFSLQENKTEASARNDEDDIVSSTSSFDDCDNPKSLTISSDAPEQRPLLETAETLKSQDSALDRPRRDDFDDDLFFLVTQGVDYLKAKECTKWDDEEKGLARVVLTQTDPLDITPNDHDENNSTQNIDELDSVLDVPHNEDLALHKTPDPLEPLAENETPVNDEELHWIVNSHILF